MVEVWKNSGFLDHVSSPLVFLKNKTKQNKERNTWDREPQILQWIRPWTFYLGVRGMITFWRMEDLRIIVLHYGTLSAIVLNSSTPFNCMLDLLSLTTSREYISVLPLSLRLVVGPGVKTQTLIRHFLNVWLLPVKYKISC